MFEYVPYIIKIIFCHFNATQTYMFNAPFPVLPGWAGTRKVNQSGFYWSKRQW